MFGVSPVYGFRLYRADFNAGAAAVTKGGIDGGTLIELAVHERAHLAALAARGGCAVNLESGVLEELGSISHQSDIARLQLSKAGFLTGHAGGDMPRVKADQAAGGCIQGHRVGGKD